MNIDIGKLPIVLRKVIYCVVAVMPSTMVNVYFGQTLLFETTPLYIFLALCFCLTISVLMLSYSAMLFGYPNRDFDKNLIMASYASFFIIFGSFLVRNTSIAADFLFSGPIEKTIGLFFAVALYVVTGVYTQILIYRAVRKGEIEKKQREAKKENQA